VSQTIIAPVDVLFSLSCIQKTRLIPVLPATSRFLAEKASKATTNSPLPVMQHSVPISGASEPPAPKENGSPEQQQEDVEMVDDFGEAPTFDEFVEGSSSGAACSVDAQPTCAHPSTARRTTVEDALDEEQVDPMVYQEHPRPSGRSHGQAHTRWERIHDERLGGGQSRWGGFRNQDEWELARWMMKCGVSQTEIDKFLKLPIVSSAAFSISTEH